MNVTLKKPQIVALCNAFEGDSILSSDINNFIWKNKRTRVDIATLHVLFEYGLFEWVSGLDAGCTDNEAVLTNKGRELITDLELATYAYSR